MTKFSFGLLLLVGLGAGCCCTGNKQQAKLIFNERDLSGWVAM